jgi:integrase
VVWTNDQVEIFLDKAFANYKWRNVGLIVMLAYEWGQRPVDIRNLKWKDIDFIKDTVTITQTKRGATVELPIDNKIMEMITQQKDDWGWQDYVVPFQRASDSAYRPMTGGQVSGIVNDIKEACGLPPELRAGDLRKTAIVQMIQGGAETAQVMSVTGHKNITSLNPYLKHNIETATVAMSRRKR